jgi:anti-anti-sigma factor
VSPGNTVPAQLLFNVRRPMTNDESTFDVHTSADGDAFIVAVFGEVDMTSAPELVKAIGLAPDAARCVVLDLRGVTFLDSSGLNAVVRGKRALDGKEIAFHVVAPADGVVRKVFEIAHLMESLSVVDSIDEALA